MKRKRSSKDTEPPPSPTSSSQSEMCLSGASRRKVRRHRGGSENQFPGKLYEMLEWVADNDLESAISWSRSGTALMIHDPEKLVEILPKFFEQTKYRSFRRQLNMWHFTRIMEGPHRGSFAHPCFLRGKKELINYMSRHSAATSAAPSAVDFGSQVPPHSASLHDWQPPQMPMEQRTAIGSIFGSASLESLLSYDPRQSTSSSGYTVARAPIPTSSHNLDERIPMFEPSAICLTESPVMSTSTNKAFPGLSVDSLNDGDPISFAGRQFHFVDHSSPDSKPASKDSPLKEDAPAIAKPLDAFANDAPLIVSDALLEPLTYDDFDSIFSGMNTDDDNDATGRSPTRKQQCD